MLFDGSGFNFLCLFKWMNLEIGVFIIFVKNVLDDKIKGFELGVDDYLIKFFYFFEFNVCFNVIFCCCCQQGYKVLEYGCICIDIDIWEVIVFDQFIILIVKEYELFLFFIINKNWVLIKQVIVEYFWGDDVDLLDFFDFVYQYIKNFCKKIVIEGCEEYIKIIYGLGYKFIN